MDKGSFIQYFLQIRTQCPYLAARHLLGCYLMALISTVWHFDRKQCDPVDKSVLQMEIFYLSSATDFIYVLPQHLCSWYFVVL